MVVSIFVKLTFFAIFAFKISVSKIVPKNTDYNEFSSFFNETDFRNFSPFDDDINDTNEISHLGRDLADENIRNIRSIFDAINVTSEFENTNKTEIFSKENVTEKMHGNFEEKLPSFHIRVTKNGFDFVHDFARRLIDERLSNILIASEKRFTASETDDRISMVISNTKTTNFEDPVYDYECGEPKFLYWTAEGGKLMLEGDWNLVEKDEKEDISSEEENGKFQVTMADFRYAVRLNMENEGKIHFVADECQAVVGQAEIIFFGNSNVTKIVNEISGSLNGWYKENVARAMCAMSERAAFWLGRLFDENFFENGPENATRFRAETKISNSCYADIWYGEKAEPSFFENDNESMILMRIGEEYLNFLAAQNDNIANFDFEDNILMRTTCETGTTCAGSIFEKFAIEYPNSTVNFRIISSKPVQLETVKYGLFSQVNTTMKAFVKNDENSSDFATFRMTEFSLLTHSVAENRLGFNVTAFQRSFEELETNFEDFQVSHLVKIFDLSYCSKAFFGRAVESTLSFSPPIFNSAFVSKPKSVYFGAKNDLIFAYDFTF